jgi:flagellar hook assembly protein FlgD
VDVVRAPRIRTYLYRPNTIVGIPDDKNPVIDNFNLQQNYPNPFNGSTTIRFQLPTRNQVLLTIYDITGKEVITLINNQNYSPGKHQVSWTAKNQTGKEVSSGIYLYALQVGARREVRKMLLIK